VSPSAVYNQITFVGITRVGISHCTPPALLLDLVFVAAAAVLSLADKIKMFRL